MGLALVLFALSLGTALAASGKGGAGGGGADLERPSAGHDAVPGLAVAADRAKPNRSRRCRRNRRRNHIRRGFTPSPPRCPRDPSADLVRAHKPKDVGRHATNGPYQAPEPHPRDEEGDEAQEAITPLPAGPYIRHRRDPLEPSPPEAEETPSDQGRVAQASVIGDMQVVRNRSIRGSGASGLANVDGGESSVATNGKVVLFTSNDGDALSTDGGRTFSYLNPATVFPAAAGGYCCDQVVAYVPRRKRFVWILQYQPGNGGTFNKYAGNVIRVATATTRAVINSGGTAWTYYDFVPGHFGLRKPPGRLFRYRPNLDRPHVTFSRANLYLTASAYRKSTAAGKDFMGTAIWRIPLVQLGRGTIDFGWFRADSDADKVRPAQGAYSARTPPSGTQWFAGSATTSRLDVFEWKDSEGVIHVHEVDVPSIGTRDIASNDPSGADWMSRYGKQASAVETGAQVGNTLVFGWMAGRKARVLRDGKVETVEVHDQPALDFTLINIDRRPLKRVAGLSVEFGGLAAALPQIRANTGGTLALSFQYGGPSLYPSHGVAFLVGWATALAVKGQRATLESGNDYLGLAIDPSQPSCFVATGSASKLGVAGTTLPNDYVDPHYVVFGRRAAGCTVPPAVVLPPAIFGADLVVDRIGGGFGSITIDVRNAGSQRAGPSKLGYSFDGGSELQVDTPALDPGQTTTLLAPCPRGGAVGVAARADATNQVTESDEANNARSGVVNCIVNRPDLVISRLYINGDAGWRIYAEVQNIGNTNAPATMTRITQQDQASVLVDTPALAPGGLTTVSIECVYGGLDDATASADATGLALESNEANNNATVSSGGVGGLCRYP